MLVLDAGSGLRGLGATIVEEGCDEIDLFLSHSHVDHVMGLPFFEFAYRRGKALRLWSGHQAEGGTTEGAVRHLMSAPLFPTRPEIFDADVAYRDFRPGETLRPRLGIGIRTAPLCHPGGATAYRIEYHGRSVCYVTDTEHDPAGQDERVLGLIDRADIVIYDAMFTDEEFPRYRGWGHSTWQEGARLCRAAEARQYVIFHHAPDRHDEALRRIETAAGRMLRGSIVAREGLTLSA